jgi:hypothetical protein
VSGVWEKTSPVKAIKANLPQRSHSQPAPQGYTKFKRKIEVNSGILKALKAVSRIGAKKTFGI